MISLAIHAHEVHIGQNGLVQHFGREYIGEHLLGNVLAIKHFFPFVYTDVYHIIIIHIVHADSIFRVRGLENLHPRGIDIHISPIPCVLVCHDAILLYHFRSGGNDLYLTVGESQGVFLIFRFVEPDHFVGRQVEPETVFRLPVYLVGHRLITVYVDCIANDLERYGSALRVGVVHRIPLDAHQRHIRFIVHPDALQQLFSSKVFLCRSFSALPVAA